MREIELHICGPVHRRKLRITVLGLNEFDRPGCDVQALGKEPPKARAGDDVVPPMLGVPEFPSAFPLLARQQPPECSAEFCGRIKTYAYDIYHRTFEHGA
jgi:hypothetical protein